MTLTDSMARATDTAPSLSDRARDAWTATAQEREVKLAERRGQQVDNARRVALQDLENALGPDALAEFEVVSTHVSEERREVKFRNVVDDDWALLHTRVIDDFDVEQRLELVRGCPETGPNCRGEVLVGIWITDLADLGAALDQRPMPCAGCAPCLYAGDEAPTSTPAPAVDPRQHAIDAFLDAFETLRELSTAGQAVDFRDLDLEPF